MKRVLLPLSAGVLAVALAACGSGIAGSGSGAGTAARVGTKVITTTDLTDFIERGLTDPDFKSNLPDQVAYQRQTLSRFINRALLDLAAERLGVTATDAEIDKQYQDFAAQANGEEALLTQAAQNGIHKDDVRAIVRDTVIESKVSEKLAASKPVNEAAIRAEYTKNEASYDQVRLQHILVKEEALANQILGQLRGGADFAALAKQYSTDPGSKDTGGIYDFAPRGQYVKPFEDAAFGTPAGQLVGPVKTDFGFHVIKVLERRKVSYDQAKEEIKQRLTSEAQQSALPNFLAEISNEVGVSVNPRFGRWDAEAQEVVAPEDELSSPAPAEGEEPDSVEQVPPAEEQPPVEPSGSPGAS